jgi:hypothetical protein
MERMRACIACPAEPMGEAWFMSEKREMFHELLGDIDALPVDALTRPLGEISSGTGSFGPMREWNLWSRYLLAQSVHRHGEGSYDSLYQHLVTALIAVHPQGIDDIYGGFADDALHTLGRCVMDAARWTNGRLALAPPEDPQGPNRSSSWRWSVASDDLSAAMFFCAKYVPDTELDAWLDSAFAIDCPLWTSQLVNWFVRADALLAGRVAQVSDLQENGGSDILWIESGSLHGNYTGVYPQPEAPPFLSPGRRAAIVAAVRRNVDEARYFAWLDSITPFEYLQFELGGVPSRFAELYLDA